MAILLGTILAIITMFLVTIAFCGRIGTITDKERDELIELLQKGKK